MFNGIAAVLILLGIDSRHYNLLHSLGPIAVTTVVLGGAILLAHGIRRLGPRVPRVIRGVAVGLEGAWEIATNFHWRLLGAAGFTLLDIGALWAACHATGHAVGWPAVMVAYFIGYLATLIPVPAGSACSTPASQAHSCSTGSRLQRPSGRSSSTTWFRSGYRGSEGCWPGSRPGTAVLVHSKAPARESALQPRDGAARAAHCGGSCR